MVVVYKNIKKSKCICCGFLFLVIGAFFYRSVVCPRCGGSSRECWGDTEDNPDMIEYRYSIEPTQPYPTADSAISGTMTIAGF